MDALHSKGDGRKEGKESRPQMIAQYQRIE
jgi:hypothetical protein